MTEVEFHTGLPDPVGFACRMLRKACRQGARVLVTAPPTVLAAVDQALWREPEREFIPHVRMPGATARVAARTPIWLAAQAEIPGAPRVVLNIGGPQPAEPAQLDRLIELVAAEADEAAAGRQRWRAYRAAGLEIRHHAATPG